MASSPETYRPKTWKSALTLALSAVIIALAVSTFPGAASLQQTLPGADTDTEAPAGEQAQLQSLDLSASAGSSTHLPAAAPAPEVKTDHNVEKPSKLTHNVSTLVRRWMGSLFSRLIPALAP